MTAATGTVDAAEIDRFSALAADWWDPAGRFRPLHVLNPVRVGYIRDAICGHRGGDPRAPRPLEGLRLIDVGCGGGLIAEPMARLGAEVVAIDAAETNIRVASDHAATVGLSIDYRATAAETVAESGERFDVVLAMEIIEHVADVPLFLETLATLMKPGGLVVLSTLNRTAKSFLAAIVGAEYVLNWLPRGTHDWRKFLKPSEVAAGLRRVGLTVGGLTGVTYNPLFDRFALDRRDLGVNYMLWAERG